LFGIRFRVVDPDRIGVALVRTGGGVALAGAAVRVGSGMDTTVSSG
jgi:hypothetical protein